MLKILLIGARGQVGRELQVTLPPLGEVIEIGREELDLTDGEKIRALVRATRPTAIVNASAYTAVDKAESEAELAYTVNALAPRILAEEAGRSGATLLHISTDYVFDGRKNTPYLETDPVNPLSVYGKTKLQGEESIREIHPRSIVLRTAWVYGLHGKSNFVKTMLRLGKEREELKIVVDQVGSPTHARDIAEAIAALLKDPDTSPEIYHFTASGVGSWFDLARAIFDGARTRGIPLAVKRVIPITTAEYPTPAVRPAYSVLSSGKIASRLGYVPPYWRDSLESLLSRLLTP